MEIIEHLQHSLSVKDHVWFPLFRLKLEQLLHVVARCFETSCSLDREISREKGVGEGGQTHFCWQTTVLSSND